MWEFHAVILFAAVNIQITVSLEHITANLKLDKLESQKHIKKQSHSKNSTRVQW
jgi:hypothetical protein